MQFDFNKINKEFLNENKYKRSIKVEKTTKKEIIGIEASKELL